MLSEVKNLKKDILVVDDNPQNLTLLIGILSKHGYKVRPAPNGELALKSVQAILPDLILLDVNMPDMDGYEVCEKLKQNKYTQNIPVIFISAMNEVMDKVKAFRVGAVDYIIKPFQIEEVLARVKTHLSMEDMKKQLKILAMFPEYNPNPVLRVKFDGTILYVNKAVSDIDDFSSYTVGSLLPDFFVPKILESISSEQYTSFEHDIGKNTYSFAVAPIPNNDSIYIYGQNITERKQYEKEILLSASVFENAIEGIIITDSKACIQKVNKGFESITGYIQNEVIGKNANILKSGLHDKEFFVQMWDSILKTNKWEGEIWNRRKNGEAYPAWLSISGIKNSYNKITNYLGIFRDIKQSHEQLKYQAYHDPLTGLPNRLLFKDRLERAIAYGERTNVTVAVLFLDIDKFKNINDTLGHRVGDLLLQEVAERLKKCVRHQDTVSRLGGDEFTVILQDILEFDVDAINVADRIIKYFETPFVLDGNKVNTTTSIGIAFYPTDSTDIETLVQNADAAMYHAKKTGRGKYVLFSSLNNME
ncbi:MAG: diguanylate cyclase [Desulfobacterales bacterium]|nr:diguanylate cyclase [Desulfobacterales bacterium]